MRNYPYRALRLATCVFAVVMPAWSRAAEPQTRPVVVQDAVAAEAIKAAGIAAQPAVAVKAAPVAAGPAPAAQAERQPPDPNFVQAQRQQRDNARNQYNGLPSAGAFKLDSLVHFAFEEGMLKASSSLPPTNGSMRATVDGSTAIWVVTRQTGWQMNANGQAMAQSITTNLNRLDVDVTTDEGIWSTHISYNDQVVSMVGQSVSGQVMLSQAGNQINATVMQWAGGPGVRMDQVVNLHKGSFQQLRAENPVEFRKYFFPLLAKASDMKWLRPGAADAYAVFTQIQPDQNVTQKIAALLPNLDADAFTVRDNASAQLATLGDAGILAALRVDLNTLSGEQAGRLREFIATGRRRDVDDVATARHNPDFLVDCLELDDPQIRAAAKAALAEALGKPIDVDVTQTGEKLANAVDEVRKMVSQLLPPVEPKPAEAPADVGVINEKFQEGAVRIRGGIRPGRLNR